MDINIMKVIIDENTQILFKIDECGFKILNEFENEIEISLFAIGESIKDDSDEDYTYLNFGLSLIGCGMPDSIRIPKPKSKKILTEEDFDNTEIIIPDYPHGSEDFLSVNAYFGEHLDTYKNIIKIKKENDIVKIIWECYVDCLPFFLGFRGDEYDDMCRIEIQAKLKVEY